MAPSTKELAVTVLAVFLTFSTAQAFGPIGSDGLASNARTTNNVAVPAPPHVHGIPRSRRFYIDDVADGVDVSPSRSRSQGSRVRKRKEVVQSVETLDDFESEVLGEKERIVVVRFHAPWCKTCKAIKIAYARLAASNPEIKFVDVALTNKNPELRSSMDVKAVPFGHVYHPQAGLVETNPLDRRHFTSFKRVLASYREGECEVPEEGAATNPFEE